MRNIIIFTCFVIAQATSLMGSNVTFAQEKQTAALAPMGALGELGEIEQRIIFNSLQESLSKYYTLSSQKMYEKAEEEAFQVMDSDECTEEQCIAIIQELLQVEYFFMFEILQTGNFQQMKITRIDIDSKRDVRTATCEDCNISKTNSKVDDLVKSVSVFPIIQEKSLTIDEMRQKLNAEDERLAKEKQEREQKKRKEEERLAKQKQERERKKQKEEERLIKEEEQRLAKIKEEEEKKKKEEEEVIQSKEKKEKRIYFEKFYPNRKNTLTIAYTSSGVDFEPISDNSTWNVLELDWSGFNIGFRHYFINNISIDVSFSQKSLSETTFQNMKNIPSSQSGSFTDTNVGVNYHWYHDSWDLFSGGGITSYTYSSKFQDSSGINYELNSSNTVAHVNLGVDYNFMNNFMNNFLIFFDMLLFLDGDHEVSYTNNPNNHTTGGPTFIRFGMGYNL